MKKFQELATHSRKPERAKLWFSSATVLEKLCTLLQSSDCLHSKATKKQNSACTEAYNHWPDKTANRTILSYICLQPWLI
jgi:hypothetical protein